MDYERIGERPQKGGGLSPAKLRSMLMGVEKKRKELDQVDLRSQLSGIDDHRGSDFSESCKDVDVVREFVECSTSTADSKMMTDRKLKNQPLPGSKIRVNEDFGVDYDSGHDNRSTISSAFEFQKTERGTQKVPAAPFSKQAPSKWDDAHKWIASPTSNRPKAGGQTQSGHGARKTSIFGHGSRKPATKVVVEVPDEKLVAFEEPDTKRMDSSLARKENAAQRLTGWESDAYLQSEVHDTAHGIEKSTGEPATFPPPPSTARSVSMRDMGTEMTPIASQEPSRNGTPVKVKSPMHSPSQPSTPRRAHPVEAPTDPARDNLDLHRMEISDKEKQTKTRKEIMELGMQLGKRNIAAWASKEEEGTATSSSVMRVAGEATPKGVIETRAEAWEEAEKAKYMARFEREEMKIQAWENHQKAKSEAEMRRMEVEVERMRAKAQDKLMSKLAAARHKAEQKRAAAETKMNEEAAKIEQQADYIRKTGQIPSKTSYWNWSCSCCC